MTSYIARRIGQALIVMLVVVTVTFVLIHLAPGDPLVRDLQTAGLSAENIERLRRLYGLDQPIHQQYLAYLGGLLRGDLGVSFAENRPVAATFLDRLPSTMILAVAALIIDFTLGIGVGAWQATRAGTATDSTVSAVTLFIHAMPVFWLGMLLVLLFAVELRWFPSSGAVTVTGAGGGLAGLLDRLHHLALPALTLGVAGAAGTARIQRAAMIEALEQTCIRAARARGLSDRRVVLGHALRTALLPTITLLGLSLPVLFSGAVLVETVFSWPGMGTWLVGAVTARDYPVVASGSILISGIVVLGNLVADLAQRRADPRTRVAAS